VRIQLRTARSSDARTPRNLVFLVDVSGSMQAPDKLPLLVEALTVLVRQLRSSDRVSIVAYAGYSGVLLEPTPGDRKNVILRALRSLSAGGSTNGAGGLLEAYRLARESFVDGGVNRVFLATDGDFNVGVDDPEELEQLIAEQARSGVYLSALGFGESSSGDVRLEAIADRGNGNYAFIDTAAEAEKVLGDELEATTTVAAHDVKIQVEFDPEVVQSYRLIGYDDRRLADEDFADDRVDAGDVGAGQSVTAMYELIVGSEAPARSPLRVKVRYKPSRTSPSELLSEAVEARPVPFSRASRDLRFSAAVTAFGGFIRGYSTLRDVRLADVERWASQAASGPGAEYRREFVDLVGRMRTLTTVPPQPARPDPEPEPEPDGCDPPFYVDPVTGIRKPKPFCMR
jgi:Ca-activated chloride channel family protein